jgi:hypothetical protein
MDKSSICLFQGDDMLSLNDTDTLEKGKVSLFNVAFFVVTYTSHPVLFLQHSVPQIQRRAVFY